MTDLQALYMLLGLIALMVFIYKLVELYVE